MNSGRMHTAGGGSRGVRYTSISQPYYISAPESDRTAASTNVLHKLCSALNGLGLEAYLDAPQSIGDLWTPLLTELTRIAHYKAGRKPIVVSCAPLRPYLQEIGLQVKYLPELPSTADQDTSIKLGTRPSLKYLQAPQAPSPFGSLFLPVVDIDFVPQDALLSTENRSAVVFLQTAFVEAGGQPREMGPEAIDLASDKFKCDSERAALLCQARVLFAYENSMYTDLARLCGCAVVLLPNAFTLKSPPKVRYEWDSLGLAWGDGDEELARALETVAEWRTNYLQNVSAWEQQLLKFVEETQTVAAALTLQLAWPQVSVDMLNIKDLPPDEQGARADRKKYQRINEQYERWTKFCSVREVDADIYAEHLAAGAVPAVSVLIDQRGFSLDSLADTLDSLGECLWVPANLLIVSDQPAPASMDAKSVLNWITLKDGESDAMHKAASDLTEWVLIVRSGTRLAPQSLVEWGLSTRDFPQARLIYADDDIWQKEGPSQYPFFKPDANVELLRCTNYLGNALLARADAWVDAGFPLFDGALYGYALGLLQSQGRSVLGHIDTVLLHATGEMSQRAESQEFNACQSQLLESGLARQVRPLERLGTWLVEYPTKNSKCVSMVVPTGLQTGYLRTLLESLERFQQETLAEVVLVCHPDHRDEVEYMLSNISVPVPVELVPFAQETYSYSAALNAGVAAAQSEFVLVCDDDTEALHTHWLGYLLGFAQQDDVGCVAPRLMSNRGTDARVTGGPLVLGVNGSVVPYNGESGLLDEAGVNSRLQLSQDVGAVAGHCFMFRKSDWRDVEGFDTENFGLLYSVLDFCLRLSTRGKRHVWTPLANVLHQGGKTIELLMQDQREKLNFANNDVTERDNLLRLWSKELAADSCYNRHLSFFKPFDIEHTIVVDWQPRRKDRPRVLACPLTSGSGQYRVVEPLNALQDASLAQTCAIIPHKRRESRVLQPLELVRAAPDRLILQHSVNDGQAAMIDKYRIVMPDLSIIQMVDDLLGEVPVKHPNRNFQVREGHQRIAQVLKKSDRLVVTTETLKHHYKKYVPDVWLLPNCLDKQWSGLRQAKTARQRLRVGWVGAGQHQGDLEMVTHVVRALAGEVDWIFMGMCTDAIKPYIKEFHDFVAIADYPKKMASLDLDIAIAPIEKNVFNECKSNLRLLEYGAMGWPVVCSDVFPYQYLDPPVFRIANETDAWLEALRKLIDDEPLRLKMGNQLYQWVQSNFLLKDKSQEWMNAIFG